MSGERSRQTDEGALWDLKRSVGREVRLNMKRFDSILVRTMCPIEMIEAGLVSRSSDSGVA